MLNAAGLRGEEADMYEPSLDGLPVLTLAYANGQGPTGRTGLTDTDTGRSSLNDDVHRLVTRKSLRQCKPFAK